MTAHNRDPVQKNK